MGDYSRSCSAPQHFFRTMEKTERGRSPLLREPCMGKTMFLRKLARPCTVEQVECVWDFSFNLSVQEAADSCKRKLLSATENSKALKDSSLLMTFPPSDSICCVVRLNLSHDFGWLAALLFSLSPEARPVNPRRSRAYMFWEEWASLTFMPGIDNSENVNSD